MAIDPRIYEKYSGRKGDPMMRKGSALSDDAKSAASREARADPGSIEYHTSGKPGVVKAKIIVGILIGLSVVVGLALNL